MRQFVAYGNSDQQSFRDPDVQASFDYLMVPGTIASYFPEATAGFVLTSGLKYVIDPRTPLFQSPVGSPKASHLTLADWHGPTLLAAMGSAADPGPILLSPSLFTDHVVREMVDSVLRYQFEYGQRAGTLKTGITARYRELAAKVSGRPVEKQGVAERAPAFVLAPYFVRASDDWARVNGAILECAARRPEAARISPVLAVNTPAALSEAVRQLPSELSRTIFFWIHGLRERDASLAVLRDLWDTVASCSPSASLVNLYGGFFSMCLSFAGLWGFNNGLGYSESREWPQLAATGAAPPRYYLPKLHAFLPPGVADLVVSIQALVTFPWVG